MRLLGQFGIDDRRHAGQTSGLIVKPISFDWF
jgi:hypothetical protein